MFFLHPMAPVFRPSQPTRESPDSYFSFSEILATRVRFPPGIDKTASGSFNGVEGCPDGGAPRNDNLSRDSGRGQFEWEIRPLINPDYFAETS